MRVGKMIVGKKEFLLSMKFDVSLSTSECKGFILKSQISIISFFSSESLSNSGSTVAFVNSNSNSAGVNSKQKFCKSIFVRGGFFFIKPHSDIPMIYGLHLGSFVNECSSSI